jgi:hypothetical protein
VSRRRELALAAIVALATLVAYQLVFGGFFPSSNGRVGHDYGYFLPQLLTGLFWFERNGALEVPWFNPSLGAGIPFFPNPNCGYYSVPQVLALVVDPLAAVRITLILFAAIGYLGTYVLLRRVLNAGVWPAMLGAVAFAFNGYFSHRMLIGHILFHSYMLLPWIVYLATRTLPASRRGMRILLDSVLAGIGFAYTFQSGNFHGVMTMILLTAVVGLILVARGPGGWSWLPRLFISGCVALLISCSKLGAAAAFMSSFPRSGYPLPGTAGVSSALSLLFRSLFWIAPANAGSESLVNYELDIGVQEFEYGVSPVPAAVMILLVVWRIVSRRPPAFRARACAAYAAIALLLLVPIAINVYQPDWNAFLKRLPILGSSSLLIRHFSAFTAFAVLLAALSLEGLPAVARPPLAWVGMLGVIGFHALGDRTYYSEQYYDPAPVQTSWRAVRSSGDPPAVTRLVAPVDENGQPLPIPIDRNDALIRGESQLICYEPIFGYFLEWYPFDRVQEWLPFDRLPQGVPVETRVPGGWCFNEPSYFLFPAQNGGAPGDPFPEARLEELRTFLDWRPLPFEKSVLQEWLDRLNIAALLAVASFLVAWPFLRRSWRSRPEPVG